MLSSLPPLSAGDPHSAHPSKLMLCPEVQPQLCVYLLTGLYKGMQQRSSRSTVLSFEREPTVQKHREVQQRLSRFHFSCPNVPKARVLSNYRVPFHAQDELRTKCCCVMVGGLETGETCVCGVLCPRIQLSFPTSKSVHQGS